MSDLAATNCGCGCDDNCGGNMTGRGFGDCNCIVWSLILLAFCGNGFNNDGCGCGNGDNSCLLLLILLLCCGNGHGFC